MSDKDTDSTILTAEQNEEVLQESSQSSNDESGAEVLADINQPQVDADIETMNSGSSDSGETSIEVVNPDESSRKQSSQHNINVYDGSMPDLQRNLLYGGVKAIESQESELDDGSSSKLQKGYSISSTENKVEVERNGTESQEDGVKRVREHEKGGASLGSEDEPVGAASGTEAEPVGSSLGSESQQVGATGGKEPRDLQETAKTSDWQETSVVRGTARQDSVIREAVEAISKRRDLQDSADSSKSGDGQETAIVSGTSPRDSIVSPTEGAIPKLRDRHDSSESSRTGDSQETAFVSDGSRRGSIASMEGNISNHPDFLESIESSKTGDSAETAVIGDLSSQNSFESGVGGDISNDLQEGMAAPSQAWLPWWQDYSPRSYQQCFHFCFNVCDHMRPISRRILKSDNFKTFRLILILIAIFVFGIGLGHLHDCAASNEMPILLMLLGIAGVGLLSASLAMDYRRSLCPNYHVTLLRTGILLAQLTFLGLFGALLHVTYTISPTFDDASKSDYCNVKLYYFAYEANFFIGAMVFAACCLYVPTVNDDEIHYERI